MVSWKKSITLFISVLLIIILGIDIANSAATFVIDAVQPSGEPDYILTLENTTSVEAQTTLEVLSDSTEFSQTFTLPVITTIKQIITLPDIGPDISQNVDGVSLNLERVTQPVSESSSLPLVLSGLIAVIMFMMTRSSLQRPFAIRSRSCEQRSTPAAV